MSIAGEITRLSDAKIRKIQDTLGNQSRWDEGIERLTLNLDFSQAATVQRMFSKSEKLKVADGAPISFESVTSFNGVFTGSYYDLTGFKLAPGTDTPEDKPLKPKPGGGLTIGG